ncbi:hypothetical protein CVT25_004624 [Psilocybe cyanescens]|uniref:Transcription elongation factor Eaf N-terminal domain-containing protein n=1 Tax=Psilocybe cyanescens TaxID=93625 RepID=A0A409X2A7_PSICY|nr:hypothetical protein CVT25_004624 [Psilocybe cyanescens]
MASTSSSSSWMPGKGRHPVNIGSSLGRAIKNRKNKGSPAPTKKSPLPERDFYSFKFNFKPLTIDTTQPATLEIKQGAESTHLKAEYHSTVNPEGLHPFSGTETPAKEIDCILIYDTETGTYTLEKLDSFAVFKYDGKLVTSRRTASPALPSSSGSAGKVKQEDYDGSHEVSGMNENRETEDLGEVKPVGVTYLEEEEEEGEEIEIPLQQARVHKPPPPPPPNVTRPVKAMPKPRAKSKSPQPTKSQARMPPPPVPASALASAPATPAATVPITKAKPPSAKAKKAKAAPTPAPTPPAPTPLSSYASEEIMEFGRPSKKARTSTPQQPPPPPPSARVPPLLPNDASEFVVMPGAIPPRPPAASSSRNAPAPPPPPPPEPVVEAESSDEEEDWEPVSTAPPTIPQASSSNFDHLTLEEELLEEEIFGDGFAEADADADDGGDNGGEGVEIDPFELEEQMEEEDEDFLDAVMSPAPPEQTRRPISLNEMAGGAALVDSEDDFSSSDDSEDD